MEEGHERELAPEADWRTLQAIVERDPDRRFGCRVLDVRGGDRAPGDHLPGSAWVPASSPATVPAHMLPQQSRDFVVLAGSADAARAMATGLRARGWRCRPCVEDPPPASLRPGPPPGALWQPDPFLVSTLPQLLPPSAGPILDLGCGGGRELVFLGLHGYRVVGVDRLPDAVELASALARHHGVAWEGWTRRVRRADELPEGPFAAVLSFRVLIRPVLRDLGHRLVPGAVLVLRTYGWPDEIPGSAAIEALPGDLGRQGPRHRHARLSPADLRLDLTDPAWSFEVGPRLTAGDQGLWLEALARWGDAPAS